VSALGGGGGHDDGGAASTFMCAPPIKRNTALLFPDALYTKLGNRGGECKAKSKSRFPIKIGELETRSAA
jgi:hypothetical protein